jgi:hypothetical protein
MVIKYLFVSDDSKCQTYFNRVIKMFVITNYILEEFVLNNENPRICGMAQLVRKLGYS